MLLTPELAFWGTLLAGELLILAVWWTKDLLRWLSWRRHERQVAAAMAMPQPQKAEALKVIYGDPSYTKLYVEALERWAKQDA